LWKLNEGPGVLGPDYHELMRCMPFVFLFGDQMMMLEGPVVIVHSHGPSSEL